MENEILQEARHPKLLFPHHWTLRQAEFLILRSITTLNTPSKENRKMLLLVSSALTLELIASVNIHDPALIKEFYSNADNYVKDTLFFQIFVKLWGKNLITSEGKEWKTQRKVLSSAFHFEFFKSILPMIQKTTQETFQNLQKTSMKDVNIMDVYQEITGEVVGKIFFGEQLNQYSLEGKLLTLALGEILTELGALNSNH